MNCGKFFTIVMLTFISGIVLADDYEFLGPNGERLSVSKSFDDEYDCTMQIGQRTFFTNVTGKGAMSGTLTEYVEGRNEPVEVGKFLMKKPVKGSGRVEVEISTTDPRTVQPNASGTYRLLNYEDQLKLAKNRYATADAALNTVYSRLMIQFSEEKKEALRERQRSWIEYRNYITDGDGGLEEKANGEKEKSVRYWSLIGGMTETRAAFLKIVGRGNPDHHLEGVWTDGNGGSMTLRFAKGGSGVQFEINIVRGRNHNLGQIDGTARFVGEGKGTAVFVDQDKESFQYGKPCTIELNFDGEKVQVVSENSQMYRGKKAYFDGVYFRFGPIN